MKQPGNWVMKFSDHFTHGVRADVWSLRGEQYAEGMTSARASWTAVDVTNRILRLKTIPDPTSPGKYLNGHIGTENSYKFTYGYVEARMRFHPYLGSHAALWLQSPQPYAVGRPEIDVAEYFGVKNPERKSPTVVHHNVYYRDDNEEPLQRAHVETLDDLDSRWSKDYHTYGLLWTPNGYGFYIDDIWVNQINEGASDTEKYVILSMLTRDYEVDNIQADKLDTYKLNVDWVKVWQPA